MSTTHKPEHRAPIFRLVEVTRKMEYVAQAYLRKQPNVSVYKSKPCATEAAARKLGQRWARRNRRFFVDTMTTPPIEPLEEIELLEGSTSSDGRARATTATHAYDVSYAVATHCWLEDCRGGRLCGVEHRTVSLDGSEAAAYYQDGSEAEVLLPRPLRESIEAAILRAVGRRLEQERRMGEEDASDFCLVERLDATPSKL